MIFRQVTHVAYIMLILYYYMGLMRGYTEMVGGYYEKSTGNY